MIPSKLLVPEDVICDGCMYEDIFADSDLIILFTVTFTKYKAAVLVFYVERLKVSGSYKRGELTKAKGPLHHPGLLLQHG